MLSTQLLILTGTVDTGKKRRRQPGGFASQVQEAAVDERRTRAQQPIMAAPQRCLPSYNNGQLGFGSIDALVGAAPPSLPPYIE